MARQKRYWNRALTVFMLAVAWSAAIRSHAILITINGLGGMSASQQQAFTDAEAFWEGVLTGYQATPGIAGPTISASIVPIDGAGGILGSAGPSTGVTSGAFLYTDTGAMQFDSADVPSLELAGIFDDVILHEMGHVLGLGTLWSSSSVGFPGHQEFYVNNSFQFTGPVALAKYQLEFNQPAATFVPVENQGGSGTANGHWDENLGGGSNTGVVDTQGRDKRFEFMTGWLNAPTFTSNTTIASFSDIGYTVDFLSDARITTSTPSPINFGSLIVGSTPSQNLTLNKTGAEATTFSVTPSNSGLTDNASNSFIAGVDTEIVSLSLVGNANGSGTAGNKAFTVTVNNLATDNNGPTVGNNDANEVVSVNALVLDSSEASFNGVSDQDLLVLNFGTVLQNSTPADISFGLFNLEDTIGLTAALDFLLPVGTGDTGTLTTDLAAFNGLAADSTNNFLAAFDTSALGSFTATYSLSVSDDQTVTGFAAGLPLQLTINGTVIASGGGIPEPSTFALGIFGLGLVGCLRRKRHRKQHLHGSRSPFNRPVSPRDWRGSCF